ncbi:MAG: hypothetical protein HYZ45_11970, partial [Burkholderiales bacterium]|nr:hypothetical protein [Burkholderiales bacterium]
MLALLFATTLLAQTVSVPLSTHLQGQVWENAVGENGKPLPNVILRADKANPETSDSAGRYTLQFPYSAQGSTVSIAASKDGYEVVNDLMLSKFNLPASGGAQE